MKKIIAITFASFMLTSLTSCFMFQKHQTCPAYSEINTKTEKQTPINIDVLNCEDLNS